MRCFVRRVIRLLLPTLALALSASAQITPAEIGETGFFGPDVSSKFRDAFPSFDVARDKNNPVKLELPFGTMYGFFHKGDPFLVMRGTGAIDFLDAVALPADKLVLKDFVWIYSKKNIALQVSDFPSELTAQLQKFWLLPSITLLEKGNVLRAEPTGDVLDAVRGFLMLDNLSGTTILAFAKSKTVKTTQLMLNGTIANPFGMGMTLTDPLISYTKKTKVPGTTMGLASAINIKNHAYDFMAEGDVKLRKPEIFVLKTASMNPQDVVNVVGALSRPVFALAAGATPPWTLGGIPSFELRPPKSASPNFPPEDQSRVVVYAAVADKPEWGIKGPALKIRGSLAIETKPKQDIAVVELVADASSLQAGFALPSFTVPASDLSFGSAAAEISAAAKATSMRITAASPNGCFTQRFSFTVGTDGVPTLDANIKESLAALKPEGFASNLKGCANAGAAAIAWGLKAGEKLGGYAADKLLQAATPVLGAQNVAAAAKAAGYTAEFVGGALASVVPDKDELLDAGRKAFGDSQVAAFGKAAGLSAEQFFGWSKGSILEQLGGPPKLDPMRISRFIEWHTRYAAGISAAGVMAGTVWFKDEALDAGKKVFAMSWGATAHLGKAMGYGAEDVAHYMYARGVPKKEIADVLELGGYAANQSYGAMEKVYGMSRKEAENFWNDVEEGGKKTCKTVLGWTRIC
jgi:hypothetical protein